MTDGVVVSRQPKALFEQHFLMGGKCMRVKKHNHLQCPRQPACTLTNTPSQLAHSLQTPPLQQSTGRCMTRSSNILKAALHTLDRPHWQLALHTLNTTNTAVGWSLQNPVLEHFESSVHHPGVSRIRQPRVQRSAPSSAPYPHPGVRRRVLQRCQCPQQHGKLPGAADWED